MISGLRGKALMIGLVPVALLAALAVVVVTQLGQAGRAIDRLTGVAMPLSQASLGLQARVDQMLVDFQAAPRATSTAERAAVVARIREGATRLDQYERNLDGLPLDEQGRTLLAAAVADSRAVMTGLAPLLPLLERNTLRATEEAMEKMAEGVLPAAAKLHASVRALSEYAEPISQGAVGQAEGAVGAIRAAVLIAAAVASAVTLAVALAISASLGRRLARLAEQVRSVRESLDLRQAVAQEGVDEIASLSRDVQGLLESFRSSLREVSQAGRRISEEASGSRTAAKAMAETIGGQQAQTSQVAAAVEQMSASVAEVARKSGEAASAADEARRQAAGGGEVVSRTVAEMRQIAADVKQSAEAIGALGRKSEEIGRIIGVINDIADQTNLLALNAAIEAARAGEHGRGFAVVADEVRKLAERTTQATEEVSRSIREIQSETGTAVQRIEAGTQRVSAGVELANSAGSALEKIVLASDELRSMVQSIAAAAEQQSAASGQISRSVEGINGATTKARDGAGAAEGAATALASQSRVLADLVGRFRL
jgi:methyl-accepting chemotaxis protein